MAYREGDLVGWRNWDGELIVGEVVGVSGRGRPMVGFYTGPYGSDWFRPAVEIRPGTVIEIHNPAHTWGDDGRAADPENLPG